MLLLVNEIDTEIEVKDNNGEILLFTEDNLMKEYYELMQFEKKVFKEFSKNIVHVSSLTAQTKYKQENKQESQVRI